MKRTLLAIGWMGWAWVTLAQSPQQSWTDLPAAQALVVDEEQNLILLDREGARIYRYLAAYEYDSAVFIGGRSNRDEGLIHPVKLSLQNRQALYVLDDAQARLMVLNPNLRIVSSTEYLGDPLPSATGEAARPIFPLSFAVGPLGEQFLIDRNDKRVVKINGSGEVELRFGGPDYGPGALYAPVDIQVDGENFVFVSDTTTQQLQVYDLYGVYRYSLDPRPGFRWRHAKVFHPWLLCFDQQQLALLHLPSQQWLDLPFSVPQPILDVYWMDQTMYLLTTGAVHTYSLKN